MTALIISRKAYEYQGGNDVLTHDQALRGINTFMCNAALILTGLPGKYKKAAQNLGGQ